MNVHQSELAHYGDHVVWLDENDASRIYSDGIANCSKSRYGLEDSAFAHIDRLDVSGERNHAGQWLALRLGTGALHVAFNDSEVCRVDAVFFVAN